MKRDYISYENWPQSTKLARKAALRHAWNTCEAKLAAQERKIADSATDLVPPPPGLPMGRATFPFGKEETHLYI